MQAEILSQGFNFIDFCYVENVQFVIPRRFEKKKLPH